MEWWAGEGARRSGYGREGDENSREGARVGGGGRGTSGTGSEALDFVEASMRKTLSSGHGFASSTASDISEPAEERLASVQPA